MKKSPAGRERRRNNYIFSGRRPKAPGVIAPRFMAMFADMKGQRSMDDPTVSVAVRRLSQLATSARRS